MPVLKCGCHMAAGTVYTAWMTTQYAWKMTSRWREDLKWCLPQEGRTQSRCLLVQMKALQGNSVPQIHLSPRPPAGLSLLSAETTSQVCEEWERGGKCVHFVMFTSSHPSLHGWLIYLSRGKTKTQKEVYKYTYSSSERVFFCKEELCCNGGLSFSALSK